MDSTSRPAIILLHGFPASRTYWNGKVQFLKKVGYKTFAIDLLGFGKSPKPHDETYSYDDHIQHIDNELKRLPIEGQVIFIGHSMGALLAARFANLYPARVTRIILLNPPLYKSSTEAKQTIYSTSWLYSFLISSPFRQAAWRILRPLSLFTIGKHTQASRERTLENVVFAGEAFRDLYQLRTPALLVVGRHDRPQYLENLASERISKSVVVCIEDVTHHSLLFQKKLIQKLILDFLNK